MDTHKPDQRTPGQATARNVIHFPLGLLGFQGVKNYALFDNANEAPLMTLQMLEGDEYSFSVAPSAAVLADYQPDVSDRDVAFLNLTEPGDAVVLNIVTLRPGRATVNAKAPVIINRRSLIGKQVIPANADLYDLRQPITGPLEEKLEKHLARANSEPAFLKKAKLFAQQRKAGAKTRESNLAHQYLDGLRGLEIGGGAHNPFGLDTRNVDFCADMDTLFKEEEQVKCGQKMKVDVIAAGDELPLPDESEDFVVSSHVIEHFFDPIKAIQEWLRVVRPGGYVFIIAPHKKRTFDSNRPRTPLQELLDRHSGMIPRPAVDTHEHYSVWITEDLLELCRRMQWNVVAHQDVDDKVGNGFSIVIQKAR